MASFIATIGLEGGLDVSRHSDIANSFAECPEAENIILDLSRATWIDSTVVTEILLFHRKNQKCGRRVVIVAQGNVGRMLLIAGIPKRISIFSSLESATKNLMSMPRQSRMGGSMPATAREDVERPNK